MNHSIPTKQGLLLLVTQFIMLCSFYVFFFWSQLLYFPSEYSLLKLYLLVVDVCILLLDGHVE